MSEHITIGRFQNAAEAHIVAGNLESAGFHPVIQHERTGSIPEIMGDFLSGILVQVPEEEEEQALFYLSRYQEMSEE